MKKYLLFSFLCLIVSSNILAQNKLELKLKQYSQEPDYTNQTHILTLENLSKETLEVQLSSRNIKCEDPRTKKFTDLNQTISTNNSGRLNNNTTLKPKELFEFSVTIEKPKNVVLGSINCTQVTATVVGQRPITESVIIKSFVPDPKNAH